MLAEPVMLIAYVVITVPGTLIAPGAPVTIVMHAAFAMHGTLPAPVSIITPAAIAMLITDYNLHYICQLPAV